MRLLKLKTQGMGSSASHAGRDLLFTYANCISPVITGYGNPQATRLRGRATNTYSYMILQVLDLEYLISEEAMLDM